MAPIALADMAPIALADIVDVADLQTRVDRKYLLSPTAVARLLARLPGAQVLQAGQRREFRYSSVYFDTPDLTSYRATAHRRRRRFKVRTRSYTDSGDCFLEVKTRTGRGTTVKQRRPHNPDATEALTDGGLRFVRQALEVAGVVPAPAALVPVLRTDYRRVTVYLPQNSARLTIDRGLQWRAYPRDWAPAEPGAGPSAASPSARGAHGVIPTDIGVTAGDLAVLETKSPGRPSAADRLLWAAGVRPVPLSKFAVGMALLRPGLPANRWHRVLPRLQPHTAQDAP